MKLKQILIFAAYLFSLFAPCPLQASFMARTRTQITNSLSTMRMPSFMQSSVLSTSWNRSKSQLGSLFSQPLFSSPSRSFFNQSAANNSLSYTLLRQHNNNHYNNQNNYNAGKQYVKRDILSGLFITGIIAGMGAALWNNLTSTEYNSGPAVNRGKAVTIFAHGLNQDRNKGYDYSHREIVSVKKHLISSDYEERTDRWGHKNGFIEGKLVTFNFNYHDNIFESSLGQDADVKTLHQTCKNYEEVDAVGVSCGASTLFNYLASAQPENIKSAVIEAAFKSPNSVFEALQSGGLIRVQPGTPEFRTMLRAAISLTKSSTSSERQDIILSYFPNFDKNGILPINVADKMPKEIPILLVCSNQDDITKSSNSIDLFNKTRSTGHNKVYLLNLQHGEHAGILDSQDGPTYRNVVHAFYRHHNRPFNKTWADAGQERFEQCPGFAAKA